MNLKHFLLTALCVVATVGAKAQDWTWVNEVSADGAGLSSDTEYYIYAEVDGLPNRFLNAQNGFDNQPTVTWRISGSFPGNTNGSSSYTLTSSAGTNFAMYDKDWACQVRTDATDRSGDDVRIASSYDSTRGTFSIARYKKCSNTISKRNVEVTANGLTTTAQNNPTSCWKFISKAQVEAYNKYVAGETNIDMTFAIKNPSFEIAGNNGWTYTEGVKNAGWNAFNPCGGLISNRCAEAYHLAFTLSQTINVPNGHYQMTAQGFYRQDDGATEATPYFFANDVKKEVPVKTGTEDNMDQASTSFTNGLYTIEPIMVEVTNGTLTIGIKSESAINQWCIFDNFRLTYLGNASASMSVNAAAKYGTFCAPFAVTVPSGVGASTATLNGNGSTIDLTSVGATIPANTPVILYAENGLAATTLYGAAVVGTPTEGNLTGVYTATTAQDGWYVLQNNDNKVGFYRVHSGSAHPTVGANRCYLTTSGKEARAFFFDEETAISAIEALTTGTAEIYSLDGTKTSSLRKGVNIIRLTNGKTQKVIVK